MNLSAMALIKDNHRALTADLSAAVAGLRGSHPGLPIEIECQSPAQTRDALAARADIIMLDNMRGRILARAVALVRDFRRAHRCVTPLIEISGGVSLGTVRALALAGADVISVGVLTHSAPALDLSLEISLRG
jgi:nicotinate-nucleotide pyrophosphorylase (carboxylating)